MNLNDAERRVLGFLSEYLDSDGSCYSFAGIMAETSLDRRSVRLACRSLKRKGFAEFHKGLWSEDGEPAGSGYCATRPGAQYLEELAGADVKAA